MDEETTAMIITKKSIPRRTVLRGMGAAVALPLLDSMFPAFSALVKAAAKPVHRFQAFYIPNGMALEYWTPAKEGADFELTPVLQPLAAFRNQMLVLSGLRSPWSQVHAGASASFLSGSARVEVRTETETLADITMDQMLAKEFGKETQLASLELSMDNKGSAGECSGGLSCAYVNTISWRSPTMPLPMENNPRAVFERLFGDSGTTEAKARQARLRQNKSILDSVQDKLTALKRDIGPEDQAKVDQYTEAVRDVERRIQRAEEQSGIELPLVEQPQGAPPVFEDHLALMFDLQVLALQTDLTRVISFMISREQGGRIYPLSGVAEAHHPLSHHQNDPAKIALMSKINAYHAKLFSNYLARLRATPDGDGSLLDHMTILYGGGLGNSTSHSPLNLPILVVGGGNGKLKGGRHLKYPGDTTLANLLVTLMDKLEMPVERMGNSNGPLPIDTLSGV
jgi:Protein of unknown function (DUF1552)